MGDVLSSLYLLAGKYLKEAMEKILVGKDNGGSVSNNTHVYVYVVLAWCDSGLFGFGKGFYIFPSLPAFVVLRESECKERAHERERK